MFLRNWRYSALIITGLCAGVSFANADSIVAPVLSGPSASVIPVNLSWTQVPDAIEYKLLERTPPGYGSWYLIFAGTASTSFSRTSVTLGTSYEYRVNACAASGVCSPDSNYIAVSIVDKVAPSTAEAAPTSTSAAVSAAATSTASSSPAVPVAPSSTIVPPPIVVYVPPPAEDRFTRNLKMGFRGEDVNALQQFLVGEGVYPEAMVTGYFGLKTRAAIIRFQEKYASEILTPVGLTRGTGFVGAVTRAKLNELYKKR